MKDSTAILFIHKFHREIRSIDFSQLYRNDYWKCLAKFSPNLLSLKVFRINHVFEDNQLIAKNLVKLKSLLITSEDMELFETLRERLAPKLTHLVLKIGLKTKEEEIRLLSGLSSFKRLKTLRLFFMFPKTPNVNHLIPCFETIAKNCQELSEFAFVYFGKCSSDDNCFDFLANFKSLRRLSIGRVFDNNNYSLNSLKNCHQLSYLAIGSQNIDL